MTRLGCLCLDLGVNIVGVNRSVRRNSIFSRAHHRKRECASFEQHPVQGLMQKGTCDGVDR